MSQTTALPFVSSPVTRRAIADALALVGVLWFVAALSIWPALSIGLPFYDGLAYWGVDTTAPYADALVGLTGSFLYSPAVALVFGVIGLMPPALFIALWAALIVGLTIWLGLPFPRIWLILLAPIGRELEIGQFNVVVTAAIVLGFGRPWLWAIPLLTKVTPGIGLLWFAVRREWRRLAIALAATVAVAAVSFVVHPDWWFDWFALIRRDQGLAAHQWPLVRLAAAAAIVVWGARTDRPWTVPLGAMVALPVLYIDSFTFLLGCVAVRHTSIRAAAVGRSMPIGA